MRVKPYVKPHGDCRALPPFSEDTYFFVLGKCEAVLDDLDRGDVLVAKQRVIDILDWFQGIERKKK